MARKSKASTGSKPKAKAATSGARKGSAAADRGVSPSPPTRRPRRHSAAKTTGSKNGGMTEQQKLFCGAFATTGDALEAAKTAGYKDASKAAKRLMGYQHVLDFIAELERILPLRNETSTSLVDAVKSGVRVEMLKALRNEQAESIVTARSATGKSQLSKEFRETIEEIEHIESNAGPKEGSVLSEFYIKFGEGKSQA